MFNKKKKQQSVGMLSLKVKVKVKVGVKKLPIASLNLLQSPAVVHLVRGNCHGRALVVRNSLATNEAWCNTFGWSAVKSGTDVACARNI